MKADAFSTDSVHQVADSFNVRWYGPLLRVAALTGFVWYLCTVMYVPHRHEPFGGDEFEAAVRALNAGYPYQLLYDTGTGPRLEKMNEGVVDEGIAILMTVGGRARERITGTRTAMTSSVGRDILLALFVATAFAIVAPAVPLPVAVASLLAFYALFKWGPVGLGQPVHWGVAFAALVVSVFLGTVMKPWTIARVVTLSGLATLAALAQTLRQEAAGVAYGVGIALMICAGLVVVVARRSEAEVRKTEGLWPLARRAALGGLLLIAVNASALPLERWSISRAMRTAYHETAAIEHGSGWPLYLSLGYISNPFNIAWRDPIGQIHAGLITSQPLNTDEVIHAILQREYLDIIVTRPWLLLENVAAKAARIHALATRRAEPFSDVAVWQRPPLARLYQTLPGLLVLVIAALWWRGTPECVLIVTTAVALGAAASAGALLVFPDYMGGVQGAIVALVVVVPASLASHLQLTSSRPGQMPTVLARRMLTYSAGLAAAATVLGGLFVAVQWARYRTLQETTVAREPMDVIAAQQFRYAHIFNDLPVARQGRIVARLSGSSDPRVAHAVDIKRGDLDVFRPEALVRTDTQLHLIAWMGNSFRPPSPPLYQGRTDALLLLCAECAPEATLNDFPFDSGWTYVSDLEWRGRYRMFSVSLNAKLKAARFVHVAAEKIVALDSTITPMGLRSEIIASARLSF